MTLLIIILLCSTASVQAAAAQISFTEPLKIKWRYQSPRMMEFTPAFSVGSVYLPLSGGELIALRALDGSFLWRAEIGGEISAAPLADRKTIFLATEISLPLTAKGEVPAGRAGILRAISNASGLVLWAKEFPAEINGTLDGDATTFYVSTADKNIYALNKSDGTLLWQRRLAAKPSTSLFASLSHIYVGTDDRRITALNRATGDLVWSYQTESAPRNHFAVAGEQIYFGTDKGFVHALNAASGAFVWRYRTGAGVQSVLQTDHGLIVASLDNFVYLLDAISGKRLWKRQLAGRMLAQPLASAGAVLVAPLNSEACLALSLSNGRVLNKIFVGEAANTSASPVLTNDELLLTTRNGVIAFAHSSGESKPGRATN